MGKVPQYLYKDYVPGVGKVPQYLYKDYVPVVGKVPQISVQRLCTGCGYV